MTTNQEAQAEALAILNQFGDAYQDVLATLKSIVGDIVTMQDDITAVQQLVEKRLIDAVAGRDLWRGLAEVHKEREEELRIQLKLLHRDGGKLEIEIPIVKKAGG